MVGCDPLNGPDGDSSPRYCKVVYIVDYDGAFRSLCCEHMSTVGSQIRWMRAKKMSRFVG
jgi:hypothetical protein